MAVLAAHLPAALFLVLNTSSDVLGNPEASVALLPVALVVVGLQLILSLTRPHEQPSAYRIGAWAVAVICVAVLILTAGSADLPGLWFVAAASAAVFKPRVGPFVLIASVACFVVLSISMGIDTPSSIAFLVYAVVTAAAGATGPFVAVRLLGVVEELARTRAELALTAADEERRRLSRDLHDALGQGLTAVALKGDLVVALLGRDVPAARTELSSLTETARRLRSELRDILAADQTATYAVEAGRAERLLREAGINVRRAGEPGPLPEAVDAALGWVVREAATNVLRHSDARYWALEAGRSEGAIWIAATNDRPKAAPGVEGNGLTGMEERLREVGGRLQAGTDRNRFILRVEVAA